MTSRIAISGMLALTAAGILGASGPAAARGLGAAMEVEAARANARAGGPVSERDKELLERYGCLSGTNNDFCRRLEGRDQPQRARKSRNRR